ncbi:hypothetical protein ACP70R_013504 [Stipagrostis hirtigluma subsp. patula]
MALLLRSALLAAVLLRLAAGGAPPFDPTRVVHVSWRPRAFLYKGFLSEAECDHLVALGKAGGLEKSMVVDRESGKSVMSEARTSSGMFLTKKQDDVVARIEERIAAWTFLPPENGEAIQILRYENGEKYEPHFDYIPGNHQAPGGHRIATVLMYLSNVKMGGETVFPYSEGKLSQLKDDTWSDCAKSGYAVKPVKGDALLFFSLHPNATMDPDGLHGSCPVVEGEKWSATKWIHVRSFDRPQAPVVDCEDEEAQCPLWAAVGECRKNPDYMVGTRDSPGFCRKSCDACAL